MNFITQIVQFNQEILGVVQRDQQILPANEAQISIESIIEEVNELREAVAEGDFVKAIDAIGDGLFFTVGVLYKCGLTAKQITNAALICYNDEVQDPMSLIYESMVEKNEYVGFPKEECLKATLELVESLVDEFSKYHEQGDYVNSVISITQILVGFISMFGDFGISAKKAKLIMNAIFEANMTKKKGVNAKRGDGIAADAVKPADFIPPEERIAKILEMDKAA